MLHYLQGVRRPPLEINPDSPIALLELMCLDRFRPEVEIRFITDELGFESDAECVEFLEKRNAEIFEQSGGKLKIKTKEALEAFEMDKRRLFRVVDIKGQLG